MMAEKMLEQAESNNEILNATSTIVFCAFTLEGYLNHVGDELINDWGDLFESLKPKAKLVLISKQFDVEISFGEQPFQTFSTIFEIRNQLAHPKTKKHTYNTSKKKVWLKIGSTKWPAEKWEGLCSLKYAKEILLDTNKIIEYLDNKLPIEKVPSFILSAHI